MHGGTAQTAPESWAAGVSDTLYALQVHERSVSLQTRVRALQR